MPGLRTNLRSQTIAKNTRELVHLGRGRSYFIRSVEYDRYDISSRAPLAFTSTHIRAPGLTDCWVELAKSLGPCLIRYFRTLDLLTPKQAAVVFS